MIAYLVASLVIAVLLTVALTNIDARGEKSHNAWIFTIIAFIFWPVMLVAVIILTVWSTYTVKYCDDNKQPTK